MDLLTYPNIPIKNVARHPRYNKIQFYKIYFQKENVIFVKNIFIFGFTNYGINFQKLKQDMIKLMHF